MDSAWWGLLATVMMIPFCNAGSSRLLEPFLNFLSAKARALEAQQNKLIPGNVLLAKQLAQMLTALGSAARSQELLAAYPS